MPGSIDGWTLAEKAREYLPELPVLYASGNSPEPSRIVAGSEFIAKPYRTSVVLEAVRRLGPS
jgi:CheY-like chemotaxis protein